MDTPLPLHPDEQLRFDEQPRVVDAADEVLQQAVADGVFPGASYGVLQRGVVIALGAAGRFTYDAQSSRIQPGTVFDLASVSKVAATTAVAMRLWQQQRLALDALLGDILPGFVIAGDAADARAQRRTVTLRMLLAHASGLPASVPLYESCSTRDALLRAVLRLPLEAEPGTRAAYSDPGFILLGAALETITGQRLDVLARELLFLPLGMRHTGYCPPPALQPLIPPTEEKQTIRRGTVQGEVHDENCFVLGGVAGHAGLFAPAADLLRLAASLLQSASVPQLFSAETVRRFTTRAELPPGSSRALGWDTPSEASSSGHHFSAGSFGHLGFTGTSLWVDPAAETTIVLLSNRTYPDRSNRGIQQLRPHFHDVVRAAIS